MVKVGGQRVVIQAFAVLLLDFHVLQSFDYLCVIIAPSPLTMIPYICLITIILAYHMVTIEAASIRASSYLIYSEYGTRSNCISPANTTTITPMATCWVNNAAATDSYQVHTCFGVAQQPHIPLHCSDSLHNLTAA